MLVLVICQANLLVKNTHDPGCLTLTLSYKVTGSFLDLYIFCPQPQYQCMIVNKDCTMNKLTY